MGSMEGVTRLPWKVQININRYFIYSNSKESDFVSKKVIVALIQHP